MVLLAFMVSFNIALNAQEIDPAYHNNEEIMIELTSFVDDYPDWVTLDSIGHSAQDSLPIWMMKLSDNPDQIESEPALLFIGQVHAEEVVGVEIVLEIMRILLENLDDEAFRSRLEGLELYFIPTANPEGLEIVHSGVDLFFRKNCRDNIGDGILRIVDGPGWDTTGVDINRNFGTQWDRGDTLFRPEENYRYNAYRGSAPFSEPESRALRDQALLRPYLFSIVYHGSRSGNSAELLIGPWFWRENNIIKRPPDASALNALGAAIAERLPKQNNPDEHYRPVQSMQRKGQLQDWYYIATGTFQYMAEVGAEIQPDEDGMRQVVDDNLTAVWYQMDLALGVEQLDGYGILTFLVVDRITNDALDATIVVDAFDHPILERRHTNEITGRFDWLMDEGEYNVTIKKFGYQAQEFSDFEVPDGECVLIEAELEPGGSASCIFSTFESITDEPLSARIMLDDEDGCRVFDFTVQNDSSIIELPLHNYQMIIEYPAHLTFTGELVIDEEEEIYREYYLPPSEEILIEDFNSDLGWERGGEEEDWGIVNFEGRSALNESVEGDYPTDADIWLILEHDIQLDSTEDFVMQIVHRPYFEPLDDFGSITLTVDSVLIWQERYSQFPDGWDTIYVRIDSLESAALQIKFEVHSDHAIGEDGWLIDRIAVHKAAIQDFVPIETEAPREFSVQSFPNPFNSAATIRYALPHSDRITLEVYNLSGQKISILVEGQKLAGEHSAILNAGNLASGIYFVKLNVKDQTVTRKLLLMR